MSRFNQIKFYWLLPALFIFTTGVSVESQPSDFIDILIQNRKYDIAETRVDDILQKDPHNQDALMFKGILTYHRESRNLKESGQWKPIESIFEPEIPDSELEYPAIDKNTARRI